MQITVQYSTKAKVTQGWRTDTPDVAGPVSTTGIHGIWLVVIPSPMSITPTDLGFRQLAVLYNPYGTSNRFQFSEICIGAVDGKHIRIVKPIKSGCMERQIAFNFQKYASVLWMGSILE
ncbi:hypothetical protein QE152_g38457 [Popillia japonica]|uniref:Uncharacterized protein n=1 Tax=Popillia japonica TaxID=7064 RepID=A0AAW1HWT4_POPJA